MPANRSSTTRAPVGVTVLTTSGSAGYARCSPSTSGAAAIASPTETACTQPRGPVPFSRPKPNRARRFSGTPRVSRRAIATGAYAVTPAASSAV
jgi:hypothetical protein